MADIYITDVIGPFGLDADRIVRQINATEDDVIALHVNSPGGSVFDGLAIMNALQQHPAAVETRVLGLAASIASVIVIGASDWLGMGEGARLMIHNPMSVVIGGADDLRKEADVLDGVKRDLVAIYMNRTGQSERVIQSAMEDETWYSAQEAVDFGFADEVISGTLRPVNHFAQILACYRRTPEELLGMHPRDLPGEVELVLNSSKIEIDIDQDAHRKDAYLSLRQSIKEATNVGK